LRSERLFRRQIRKFAKLKKLIGKTPEDAADIALFGRMVASKYTVKLEGAAMFSHALSTHKVDNDIDFFLPLTIGSLKKKQVRDILALLNSTQLPITVS